MAGKKEPQQANYAVYDLETTGLKPNIHGVCEVAIMMVDSVTLEELGRYEAIVAPYQIITDYDDDGKPIKEDYICDPIAFKINGFTKQKIETKGRSAKQICQEIKAFEKKHRSGGKKSILVGHNIIRFDNPHLDQLFESKKEELEKVFSSTYFKDTQTMSHDMFPDKTGKGEHTLDTLCERLGVDKFDAHSAMPDVVANAGAFIKMLKKFNSVEGGAKFYRFEGIGCDGPIISENR